MANIIGLQQQQAALDEINAILKDIKTVNKFLEAVNSSGKYQICFTDDEGQKHKPVISASKEDIDALVSRFKAERTQHIQRLAEDFKIALDPEDREILGIDG